MEQIFNATKIISFREKFIPKCEQEHTTKCTKKDQKESTYTFLEFKKIKQPLDDNITKVLETFESGISSKNIKEAQALWIDLIEKAVQCLRFYDNREPFITNKDKSPYVYGLEDLNTYFKSFIDFEAMLYGSNSHYRDHVIHTLHVWGTGVAALMQYDNLIEEIKKEVFPIQDESKTCTKIEVISIWTIIALCHDLGYPLEKSRNIIEKTKNMMQFFVQYPKMPHELSFSGVQDELNQFILKFMSSKMTIDNRLINDHKKSDSSQYIARIQSKYYIKFSKSLEQFSHGVISAIILYKTLMYFVESEYSLNEDYHFTENEAKQFFIRREILRSISTHTCPDIYHMSSQTLSFLLVTCDDMQEWDRRNFQEIYTGEKSYEHTSTISEYTEDSVLVKDTIKLVEDSSAIYESKFDQIFYLYRELQKRFRDGLETQSRRFTFTRTFTFAQNDGTELCCITLEIPNKTASTLTIKEHSNATSNCRKVIQQNITQNKFEKESKNETAKS